VSIQAIAWVLDQSRAQGIDRLVLIALANHANAETGRCDPGQRRIAQEANCSPGMVTVSIRRLAELGEVAIEAPGQGRATTKYHLPWLSTGFGSARPGSRATEPVARDGEAVARDFDPVARDLDRAKPEPVLDRTAHGAADPADAGGAVAPKIVTLSDGSRWCPDTGELMDPEPVEVAEVDDELASRRRHPASVTRMEAPP
jgi:hypothetical protein